MASQKKKRTSECPHVLDIGSNSWEDINKKMVNACCETCSAHCPNLWLCLYSNCLYVGCGENREDHSGDHTEKTGHCLILNLSTKRIWCDTCECEVYKEGNDPPLLIREVRNGPQQVSRPMEQNIDHLNRGPTVEESTDEDEESEKKSRGLTGLQNLGNTCYLNAALQALSNCPPLTQFFIDCDGFVQPTKKPQLARSYSKLVHEIWHPKRPSYVTPTGIVKGIQMVHPMFKGYNQQDTQEFLRCFMDQLHEELKEPLYDLNISMDEEGPSRLHTLGPGQEFESGDSGLSSRTQSDTALPDHSPNSADGDGTLVPSPSCTSLPSHSADSGFNGNPVAYYELSETASDSGKFRHTRSATWPVQGRGTERVRTVSRSSQVTEDHHWSPGKKIVGKGPARTYRSIITDIFDGRLLSSVQCLTCELVSSTKETFQDLSLPIPSKDQLYMLRSNGLPNPGHKASCGEVVHNPGWIKWFFDWLKSWVWGPYISLQDCLAAFFSADELKGDNMYSCDKCKKLRNGVKFSKVLSLPEVLCIHLKRFRHEFTFSSKINSHVTFPIDDLDLKPYLHKDCKDQVTEYDLMSVICHHGTAGGGHYTCYALNPLNSQWYEFDDQYVTEVSVSQVINSEAYVLFYRKKQDLMLNLRQKAKRYSEAMDPNSSFMKFWISRQWINRFNTFAEPGCVANTDVVCRHGGVFPDKWDQVSNLVWQAPQGLWELFHQNFGGGPAVTHLYPCVTCKDDLEKLHQRQDNENETFGKLHGEFQAGQTCSAVYAISIAWFGEWERFVRKNTNDPPGPIDNTGICTCKGGVPLIKVRSDYGQISEEAWNFLFDIYGGGPTIMLYPPNKKEQNEVEEETAHL